jgi:hypothetical protein
MTLPNLKNEGDLQQAVAAKTKITSYQECNILILTEAVRLREMGLNHDAAILTSASTLIEAKIKDLQQAYKESY